MSVTASFKAPIVVVDALRAIILAQYVQCQQRSEPAVWETLDEKQRQEVNRLGHYAEMAARFFDVTLPKREGA